MRIKIATVAAAVVITFLAIPGIAQEGVAVRGYWMDGARWQQQDNNVKTAYLMGAWDSFAIGLLRPSYVPPRDLAIMKCANENKYDGRSLVTIVDNYYNKTNDLKIAPADALYKGLVDLCIPKRG